MKNRPALAALALGLAVAPALASPSASSAPVRYHLIQTFRPGGNTGWDYLTVDAQSRRFYISRGTHVQVLNADNGKLIGDITSTTGVHGIALAPSLGRGFTSNGRVNTVSIIDLKTLKTIGTVPVGKRPDAIIYDPSTRRVFTFNGGSNDSTAIDAVSGKVVGTIPLGGQPEFAVADGSGMIYNNIADKGEIVAIDSKTLVVKSRWPISAESPSGLTMDTKSRRLFAVCDGHKMVVLNADTGAIVAAPAIGNGPDAAGFDPKTHLAFSSNGQDGTLTVLHEDTPNTYSVVQTVPTQEGARTLAIDTKTHHVFVVTAKSAPAAPGVPRWQRSYLPGTFVVLVYGQ